jgi:hypothetical protein
MTHKKLVKNELAIILGTPGIVDVFRVHCTWSIMVGLSFCKFFQNDKNITQRYAAKSTVAFAQRLKGRAIRPFKLKCHYIFFIEESKLEI